MASATAGIAALPLVAFSRSTALAYAFSGPAANRSLGLTPPLACTRATPRKTEGPYYTQQTPARANLREPDTRGQPLVLHGLVLTPDCQPVAGTVVDIWHSDENGRYDNSGFRYRGHQFTDSVGAFRFETIRPARYRRRTSHIHVKVQGASTAILIMIADRMLRKLSLPFLAPTRHKNRYCGSFPLRVWLVPTTVRA